jgi:hypothetical protein
MENLTRSQYLRKKQLLAQLRATVQNYTAQILDIDHTALADIQDDTKRAIEQGSLVYCQMLNRQGAFRVYDPGKTPHVDDMDGND